MDTFLVIAIIVSVNVFAWWLIKEDKL